VGETYDGSLGIFLMSSRFVIKSCLLPYYRCIERVSDQEPEKSRRGSVATDYVFHGRITTTLRLPWFHAWGPLRTPATAIFEIQLRVYFLGSNTRDRLSLRHGSDRYDWLHGSHLPERLSCVDYNGFWEMVIRIECL